MLHHDGIQKVRSHLGFVDDPKHAFFRIQRGLVGAMGFLAIKPFRPTIRINLLRRPLWNESASMWRVTGKRHGVRCLGT